MTLTTCSYDARGPPHMMRWTLTSVLIMGPLLARQLRADHDAAAAPLAAADRPAPKGHGGPGREIVTRQGFVELRGALRECYLPGPAERRRDGKHHDGGGARQRHHAD